MGGLAVGIVEGGPSTPHYQAKEFISRLRRKMASAGNRNDEWSVNVVFIIPGPVSRPDFAGVRSGKFDRSRRKLAVQVAVPDTPIVGWKPIARFVLDSLDAATREADEFFRLEGLEVDLGEAWEQLDALQREIERNPEWTDGLPDEAVDRLTPEERTILREFEAGRAAAAPIRAQLVLHSSDDGGRRFPISSGHSTECCLGTDDRRAEGVREHAVIYVEDSEGVDPGRCGMVRIHPIYAERWTAVRVGTVIGICEGGRVVGEATVVEFRRSLSD